MRKQYETTVQQAVARRDLELQTFVTAAVTSTEELGAAMNCIPAFSFLDLEIDTVAEMHEGYRQSGSLKIFDRLQDVWEAKAAGAFIVFFSYECLAWKQAGPNKDQLHCMKESVKTLACQNQKNMDDVYVWLDCISIPQRNKAMQATSINSIYSFASLPNAMVIVCPDSIHVDTGQPANKKFHTGAALVSGCASRLLLQQWHTVHVSALRRGFATPAARRLDEVSVFCL